jgi:hypothetical protein
LFNQAEPRSPDVPPYETGEQDFCTTTGSEGRGTEHHELRYPELYRIGRAVYNSKSDNRNSL